MVLTALIDKPVMLQLFVKNLNGYLVDQPVNYPKINIFKVEDSGVTEILVSTSMQKHLDGEYYYEWEGSSNAATYKARYEAQIDGVTFYGHDVVILTTPDEVYNGWGV